MTLHLRNSVHDQPIWKRRVVGGSLLTAGIVVATAVVIAASERPVSASPSMLQDDLDAFLLPSASGTPRLLANPADGAREISAHSVTTAEYIVSPEDDPAPKILLLNTHKSRQNNRMNSTAEPVWLTGTVNPIQ